MTKPAGMGGNQFNIGDAIDKLRKGTEGFSIQKGLFGSRKVVVETENGKVKFNATKFDHAVAAVKGKYFQEGKTQEGLTLENNLKSLQPTKRRDAAKAKFEAVKQKVSQMVSDAKLLVTKNKTDSPATTSSVKPNTNLGKLKDAELLRKKEELEIRSFKVEIMKINEKICGFNGLEDYEKDTSQDDLNAVKAEIKTRPNIQNSPDTHTEARNLLDQGVEVLKGLMKERTEVIGKEDFNYEDNNLQDRLEADIFRLSEELQILHECMVYLSDPNRVYDPQNRLAPSKEAVQEDLKASSDWINTFLNPVPEEEEPTTPTPEPTTPQARKRAETRFSDFDHTVNSSAAQKAEQKSEPSRAPYEDLADAYNETYAAAADYLQKLNERKNLAEQKVKQTSDPSASEIAQALNKKENEILQAITADIERLSTLVTNLDAIIGRLTDETSFSAEDLAKFAELNRECAAFNRQLLNSTDEKYGFRL